LRLEISCEIDKKKMNFIFDYDQKNFLTAKRTTRVGAKTETVCQKISANETATDSESPRQTHSLPIVCASRVDRIGLRAQFPASASGGQTLSKL
jgi:hypothetical protein